MADAQRRAVENHRRRLREQGLGRFEVRGLDSDKGLIRAIAKRLAHGDAVSAHLRSQIEATVGPPPDARGGILNALRRSPVVGADLDFTRETTSGREIDL